MYSRRGRAQTKSIDIERLPNPSTAPAHTTARPEQRLNNTPADQDKTRTNKNIKCLHKNKIKMKAFDQHNGEAKPRWARPKTKKIWLERARKAPQPSRHRVRGHIYGRATKQGSKVANPHRFKHQARSQSHIQRPFSFIVVQDIYAPQHSG